MRVQVLVVAAVLLSATLCCAQSQPITCPAQVSGAAPQGWTGPNADKAAPFERVSVFNRDKDGKNYDLAPDDEKDQGSHITQVWELTDYRDLPLLLRCRYKGTEATLTRELPAELKTCTFTYTAGKHGEVVAKPSVKCE